MTKRLQQWWSNLRYLAKTDLRQSEKVLDQVRDFLREREYRAKFNATRLGRKQQK